MDYFFSVNNKVYGNGRNFFPQKVDFWRNATSTYPYKIFYDKTPPKTGAWNAGDMVMDANPSPGQNTGWICTISGTPGKWAPVGLMSAPNMTPTDGQVLTWDDKKSIWTPKSQSDRTLIFSEDIEYIEAGKNPSTKKTFRLVKDSQKPPKRWRVIASLWVEGNDTAICRVSIGGNSVELRSAENIEKIQAADIPITSRNDVPLNAAIQLRLLNASGAKAHLKYINIYAVY